MPFDKKEIGNRVRQIRERLGLTHDFVATRVDVETSMIIAVENGDLDPLPGDLILYIADALSTDFRYFVSTAIDERETTTDRILRALKEPTSQDLLALRKFTLRAGFERDLEVLLEINNSTTLPKYEHVLSQVASPSRQGQLIAQHERQRLKLGDKPVDNIFEILRSQGIRVTRQSLSESTLSGVSVVQPYAGLCVLVNYDEDLYRQFFSAAHEYAHMLLDRDRIVKESCIVSYDAYRDESIEKRANSFAANFLVPVTVPKTFSNLSRDQFVEAVAAVARKYRVNTEVAAISFDRARVVAPEWVTWFRNEKPVVIKKSEKSDPDISENLSTLQRERRRELNQQGISSSFLELLRRALIEGKISFARFAEMLGMPQADAEDLVLSMGVAL